MSPGTQRPSGCEGSHSDGGGPNSNIPEPAPAVGKRLPARRKRNPEAFLVFFFFFQLLAIKLYSLVRILILEVR